MNRMRIALFLCGAALFVGLLVRIGPAAVIDEFLGLSWRLPLIVLFPACVVTVCDALGWRYAFRRDRVPFAALLAARLAGEAFNLTTPTASVGGEAVKAWLVRPYAPFAESVPSAIVAKTTHTIAQALFLLLGVAVARLSDAGGSLLLRAMEWFLIVEMLAIGGFVVVQTLGARRLARFGVHRWLSGLTRVDEDLTGFYRREHRRLLLSVAWYFVGWTLGVLETYIILKCLGVHVSLAGATVIEAFGTGIGFAAFLVPGRLGAVEAGNVAVFAAFGLGGALALAVTLLQRLREVVWAGIGFLALVAMRGSTPAPALEPKG